MKNIDDEDDMTCTNLKAMLAVVPKEPGTLFIALCVDYKGSLSIAVFYISAIHGPHVQFGACAPTNSAPKQSLQVLKVRPT